MRVLITGANGQLGQELVKNLTNNHLVFATTRKDLDITDQMTVDKIILDIKPEMIIHTAAYTAVDQAEIDKNTAFEVNILGAFHVARAARRVGAKMVYISTDYVFDGHKLTPYKETDEPKPLSTYGLSKWLGERLVHTTLEESFIVRTSWLYGHDGKNFVNTMLHLAKQQKEIKVVNDQIGSPTYTKDLVGKISQLFEKKYGTYHVSNSGTCSWFEFARFIFLESGYDPSLVKPVSTKEYGAISERPKYSVLGNNSLITAGIEPLRPWQSAVREFIRKELSSHD